MAKRGFGAKALAPVAARPRARVIFVLSLSKDGSCFVDEHQSMGLETHLRLPFSFPRLARLAHVGPIAFARLKAFF